MTSVDTWELIRRKKTAVQPLLEFFFNDLLSGVKNKLRKRATNAHPWKVVVHSKIPGNIFLEFYRTLRDYKIRTFREIEVTRKKDGSISRIVFTFTNIGPLKFHLGQATDITDIAAFKKKYFCREWPDGCEAAVSITPDKAATLVFNMKTQKMTFSAPYEVRNSYGNLCL